MITTREHGSLWRDAAACERAYWSPDDQQVRRGKPSVALYGNDIKNARKSEKGNARPPPPSSAAARRHRQPRYRRAAVVRGYRAQHADDEDRIASLWSGRAAAEPH